jgi:tRNA A37 threonylcarbamoyladenosine dehydratase
MGADTMSMFRKKKIIIFGVGGAGGYAAEALARAGIYSISIVDHAIVDITDINRQITALQSTIGRKKTEVMEERIRDINPEAEVGIFSEKLGVENIASFRLVDYDYIIDALDDIPAKLLLISESKKLNIPIISCMSTGNRFDPVKLNIDDIKRSNACPMSKLIRKEMGSMGIKNLKVLFSTEEPHREEAGDDDSDAPSSISFVPSSAGILIAAEVVRDLLYSAPTEKTLFGIKLAGQKVKAGY